MKKLISLLLLIALASAAVSAQRGERLPRPVIPSPFKYVPGWVSITDVTYGFGLGETKDPNNPCDKSFISLTSVLSYQISRNFTTGGGFGLMFNEDRFFVPAFLNGRYNFSMPGGNFIPYLNADAGALLNFKDFNYETRFFVHPSAGVRYVISSYVSATGGLGILTHTGPATQRNSFFTIRLGVFISLNKQ